MWCVAGYDSTHEWWDGNVGPVLVHVVTEKGRGYLPAETSQVGVCRYVGQLASVREA
jgi:deoxyxylulose-5-phosphate synthase